MQSISTRQLFVEMMRRSEGEIELDRAALLIAREEYPDLEVEKYLRRLDRMAEEVRNWLEGIHSPLGIIQTMNRYLFEEEGFTGNTENYYDPRNSFLNQVLDRKTGIPILLSILYMEIGRRIEFPVFGVGFPGHFLVKSPSESGEILIDPFNKGAILSYADCQTRLDQIYGGALLFQEQFLAIVTKKQILTRVLQNLKGIYIREQNYSKAFSAIERILLINPNHPQEIRDRGLLYYNLERYVQALADLERYVKMVPDAPDRDIIQGHIQVLRKLIASTN
ncbi:MAG TPA: tetratricopeptide repeat protein [Candidatus Limnocylindrales bacterium]|nr:tetratricopeptide repeat protein [Candidatus Limnocylindrales bacterium]